MRRNNRHRRKTKGKLFSSKRVFLLLFFIFIVVVIVRFLAINGLDTSSKDKYLYQFSGDIYANFYIENNQTIFEDKGKKRVLHPYSFVELNPNGHKAIYQLLPDKQGHTISMFTHPKWFEIIGGDYKSRDGDSIIRLSKNDTPSLLIFNANKKRSLLGAKRLKVIALKDGYYYHSLDNKKRAIPIYSGSLSNIRNSKVWNSLSNRGIVLDSGYITDRDNNIIKIYMGTKNKSVLVSKNPKRYNLIKAKTINVSIVDKNTPSSSFKLVYADKALLTTRLSYDFVRISHLLIKYGILNAKNTIKKYIKNDNFLQKELLDLVQDRESLKKEKFYQDYIKKRIHLSKQESHRLNMELLKNVSDGDYYRTKISLLLGANVNILNHNRKDLLSIALSNQKKYLSIPKEMKFEDNRLTIRGNKNLFKNSTYTKGAYFPPQAPILDKPKIPKKEYLNVAKLNEFIDVTHLNGIYVSDPNAQILYSKTARNFLQIAQTNYQKAPPLFLFDSEIEGKFVAPIGNIKGKFYYKIRTNKSKIKVAFNGIIRQNGHIISRSYNKIVPFYNTYTINVHGGSAILEVSLDSDLLPCGVVFKSSKKIKNFRYSYNDKRYKLFEVINRGDGYYYKIRKDSAKPFKKYYLHIKADESGLVTYLGNSRRYNIGRYPKIVGYSPSLACLAKDYNLDILSLYDKDNIMEIVPKTYQDSAMIPKERAKIVTGDIKDKKIIKDIISKQLLPIYGDGVHFGLTSKGVKANELTLDEEFTKEVANIFEEVIKPLKSPQNRKKREKYNSILEGAVVVLADKGKDNLEVVSLFSYPYPKKLDITKTEKYKKEIFRYMLLDEFNNPKSSLRDRALDMRIRPGSTFKIVSSIAGFKRNIIPILDRKYSRYIEGKGDIKGAIFRDNSIVDIQLKNFSFSNGFVEKTDNATFRNSFKKSYNVYFGYLALLLNHKLDHGFKKELYPISNSIKDRENEFTLMKVADDLGFNKPIVLSKEKKIYASPSVFPEQFILAKEVADSGIGQFEVAGTPMQMAIVANTIRTRNIEIPKIIKSEKSQIVHKNYIRVSTQKAIQDAMRDVIIDRDGTAKCAFYYNSFINQARAYNKKVDPSRAIGVPCLGYRAKFQKVNPKDFAFSDVAVYGKTGTAEKGKGKLYDGWFVSFTKSKKRGDIVVAVVVRNSGTGGTYSATINKRVIEAWYRRVQKVAK